MVFPAAGYSEVFLKVQKLRNNFNSRAKLRALRPKPEIYVLFDNISNKMLN